MMQQLRKRTRLVLFIAVAAFVLLIFFNWGLNVSGRRGRQSKNVARIDGISISYQDYINYIRNKENRKEGITRDKIWPMLIDDIMWAKLIKQEHIKVTDEELWSIIKNNPPPEIYNSEYMKDESGKFDWNKYYQLLKSPQSLQWLYQYERQLRNELPKEKLRFLLTTLGWVSPFEDSILLTWPNTKYDLSFISISLYKIHTKAQISDEEIKKYFEEHKKEFVIPKRKILKYVFFPRRPSPADTAEARERLEDFLAEVKAGEDFFKLARDVSDDTLIQYKFENESVVKPYLLKVYKNLKDGEVSDIFKSAHGFEVIKRVHKGLIYRVKANIEISATTIDDIYDRINAFKESVKELGFDSTAADFKIPVRRTNPFTADNVNFPLNNRKKLQDFVAKAGPKDIGGPFNSIGGYYLFALDSVIPAKKLTLKDARPRIMAKLENKVLKDTLRQYLTRLYNELQSGKTMSELSRADTMISFQSGIKDQTLLQIATAYGGEFAGVVASLNEKEISHPLITDWAGYIIRCDRKVVLPADTNMVRMLQYKLQERLSFITQELFTPENIEDNRDDFFLE